MKNDIIIELSRVFIQTCCAVINITIKCNETIDFINENCVIIEQKLTDFTHLPPCHYSLLSWF